MTAEPAAPKPDAALAPARKANRRSAARLAAVQALYQMDIGKTPLPAILDEFVAERLGKEIDGDQYLPADSGFFRDLVSGVVREQRDIDRRIDAALADGWPLRRIDATLRAVLRAGVYEAAFRTDIPVRVAIAEYVEIARAFFDDGDEPRMTNAVLDRLARAARPEDLPDRPARPTG